MSSTTVMSTNEAVQQLRAEIISPDWQLSPQRITRLKAAFLSLTSYFSKRPHPLALLRMAISVISHFDQDDPRPDAMDFLKENMAHIVNIFEEDDENPEQEKEIVSRLYKRFLRLGISLVKNGEKSAKQGQIIETEKMLEKLAVLAEEADRLPAVLEKTPPLTPEQSRRVSEVLEKISVASNRIRALIPPAKDRE